MPRAIPEVLMKLGTVNRVDPDLDRSAIPENGNRVAIADPDTFSLECLVRARPASGTYEQQKHESEVPVHRHMLARSPDARALVRAAREANVASGCCPATSRWICTTQFVVPRSGLKNSDQRGPRSAQLQRLAHIFQQILDVFDADAQPDELFADPALLPDFRREAGVRHGRRLRSK